MADVNLGQLSASLTRKYVGGKNPEDMIGNKNGFLWVIKEKGGFKKGDFSGNGVAEILNVAELDDTGAAGTPNTIGFYKDYEVFNPTLTEQYIDAATYDFKQLGAMIAYSGAEKIKWGGKEKRVELVASRVQGALTNLENMAAASCFGDGTGTGNREFGGLDLLVQTDPTTVDTVAGIPQATYTWWQNQIVNGGVGTAPTSANILKTYLNPLHLKCTKKGESPDLCIMDTDFYLAYEDSEQGKVRHTNVKMADAGFDNYMYKKMTVIFDENVTAKNFFMLNSNSIHFRYAKDRFFTPEEARKVVLGDYDVQPIWCAGNLTCKNRARQGRGFYTTV